MARYSPRGNIDGKLNDNVPDVAEQSSDESSQGTKDNNQPNTTPGKEVSVENHLFPRNISRKCLKSSDIKCKNVKKVVPCYSQMLVVKLRRNTKQTWTRESPCIYDHFINTKHGHKAWKYRYTK